MPVVRDLTIAFITNPPNVGEQLRAGLARRVRKHAA